MSLLASLPPGAPSIALGVVAPPAVTDAAYVFFNAAVGARKRVAAATWSSCWYLLSAFAVISYTSNWAYVLFAAIGAWIGGYLCVTLVDRGPPAAHPPPR